MKKIYFLICLFSYSFSFSQTGNYDKADQLMHIHYDTQLAEYIQILSSADMVKYAKHRISIEQCSKDLLQSRALVQDTVKYWKISSNS